ncbi:MAG: ATP-dependent helicase, partial [Thermomicrobiales bacterium]|nr:ATP-dependent helicase [Thermomicrobiales bacterium]
MVEVVAATGVRFEEAFAAGVSAPDGLALQLDPVQRLAVHAPSDRSLFLVAGPGSGKTSVIVLRMLKLILVDGLPPGAILATTFTRKAAAELHSRVLEQGETMRAWLLQRIDPRDPAAAVLRRLDFGMVMTGTIDSIAQSLLTDFRPAGTQPPVAVEEFVAESFLLRHGLWPENRRNNPDLLNYATQLDGRPSLSQGALVGLCREVRERMLHDMVDVAAFAKTAGAGRPAAAILAEVVADFAARLDGKPLVDFAGLEDLLRTRIAQGELKQFVTGLRVVLVDEYQDTNLLQEAIYFGLAEHACKAGGSIAVVGDDDQALYRFRGATVALFRDFPDRLHNRMGAVAQTIHLVRNYRSTPAIVRWCSNFAELDPDFQLVRVKGKPSLVPARANAGDLPVLGLFRPTPELLATDLACFLGDVFRGAGATLPNGTILARHAQGDVGDCAVLFSSPKERSGSDKPRLPSLLAERLAHLPDPIAVHNPRGAAFHALPEVAALCGLMLECIDPGATIQQQERLP